MVITQAPGRRRGMGWNLVGRSGCVLEPRGCPLFAPLLSVPWPLLPPLIPVCRLVVEIPSFHVLPMERSHGSAVAARSAPQPATLGAGCMAREDGTSRGWWRAESRLAVARWAGRRPWPRSQTARFGMVSSASQCCRAFPGVSSCLREVRVVLPGPCGVSRSVRCRQVCVSPPGS